MILGGSAYLVWRYGVSNLSKSKQSELQALATENALADDLQKLRISLAKKGAELESAHAQLRKEQDEHQATRQQLRLSGTRVARLKTKQQQEEGIREEFEQRVKETFEAIANSALAENKTDFLQLAEAGFTSLRQRSQSELGQRETAVRNLEKPIQEAFKKHQESMEALGATNAVFGERLEDMTSNHGALKETMQDLLDALRRPQVRGRYGEAILKRVVELAGMNSYCDFQERYSTGGKNRIRPDMVISMPGDRIVIIDAKISLENYLLAIKATDPEEQNTRFEKHSQNIRTHIDDLASKNYSAQFERTPDFVVMFVGGEQFLTAALKHDADLLEYALGKKIIPTTPSSLMGLLLAIAHSWQQEIITDNIKEVSQQGQALYEGIVNLLGHWRATGKELKKSVVFYGKAVGSLERNLASTTKQIKELSAHP